MKLFAALLAFTSPLFAARLLCNFAVTPPSNDCLIYSTDALNARLAERNKEWPFGNKTTSTRPLADGCVGDDGRWATHFVKDPVEASKLRMVAGANYVFVLDCKGRERSAQKITTPDQCDGSITLSSGTKELASLFHSQNEKKHSSTDSSDSTRLHETKDKE